MTLFEYIAVANSIILSFAVVRLLDALPPAFDSTRRYWTHCAFVVVAVWMCAQYWWVSWSFASVEVWTYPKFLLYLAPPALLYSVARTLGSPDPNGIDSFRVYFQQIHQRLFTLVATYMLLIALGSCVISGISLGHPIRIGQLVTFSAYASGALVTSPRYHALLAVFSLLALTILTFRIFANPAPLAMAP